MTLNRRDFIGAITWAAGGPLPFEIEGPEYLAANYTYQLRQQRYLIHLVNYNAMNALLLKDLEVKVELPDGKKVAQITQYGPDSENAHALRFNYDGARTRFTVPKMASYTLIAVQL